VKSQSGQELATGAPEAISSSVPPESVVIVSDAHLGHAPESVVRNFHLFLETMPQLGRHLIINGDLFDFWFEYRRVISRDAFPTLSALLQKSNKSPLMMR